MLLLVLFCVVKLEAYGFWPALSLANGCSSSYLSFLLVGFPSCRTWLKACANLPLFSVCAVRNKSEFWVYVNALRNWRIIGVFSMLSMCPVMPSSYWEFINLYLTEIFKAELRRSYLICNNFFFKTIEFNLSFYMLIYKIKKIKIIIYIIYYLFNKNYLLFSKR